MASSTTIRIQSITGKVGPKPFKLKLSDLGSGLFKISCENNLALGLVYDAHRNTVVGNCALSINQDHSPCGFNVQEISDTKRKVFNSKHLEFILTITLFE